MSGGHKGVAVLLCTYNGARHLDEQLRTLAAQQGVVCDLWASDDGSTDETLELLRQHRPAGVIRTIRISDGPQRGYAANFLRLLAEVETATPYYAFCDQDDLWDADKLARAISRLESLPQQFPALYCSRARFVDERGEESGQSPLFSATPAFANALVQNIAGGNTMVFNRAALHLLKSAGQVDVTSHDWWAYLLISGAGGGVIYDPEPGLCYRQHTQNVIGANVGSRQRARRYLGALGGRNREWNQRNVAALASNRHLLSSENQQRLDLFRKLRSSGITGRLQALRRGGFYAQTWPGNLGLFIATLLKKM